MLRIMYAQHRRRNVLHGYGILPYSSDDLIAWAWSQHLFHDLYDLWVLSGYDKMKRPSIDRKDDYVGYKFGNIQLMTWQDNFDKANADRRDGTNAKTSKAVRQYMLNGSVVEDHHSIKSASRKTNSKHQGISYCCNGERDTHNGFRWSFI